MFLSGIPTHKNTLFLSGIMRSPCNTLLLKIVELSNRKVYLIFDLLLVISLHSLFNRPTFFNDCGQEKSMKENCVMYRIRRNFRMAKFSKMTGLQAFRKNIFEN